MSSKPADVLVLAQALKSPMDVSAKQAIFHRSRDLRGDRLVGVACIRNMGERRFWERKSPTQAPVLVPGPEDRGASVHSQARPLEGGSLRIF